MKTLHLPPSIVLHDYQRAAVDDIRNIAASSANALYAAPTGTGKSIIELALLAEYSNWSLITPRLEIVAGMLNKGGIDTRGWSDEKLASEALSYRITTPIRARNMLAKGVLPWRPSGIIWDEAHHRAADSYQDIRAYLPGVHEIGLTASPFRGTPKGTDAFLDSWDTLTWILTYPQAAARGVIAVPQCTVWPLVDDDELEIVNGEIVIKAAEAATLDALEAVVERCKQFRRERMTMSYAMLCAERPPLVMPCWDRPTIFAVPTTLAAGMLEQRLLKAGLPAKAVTQDTPRSERAEAFRMCEAGEIAIVQIDVVSEGVDLKLRRLIDLRPTLSPVKWLQQVGRVTRPSSDPPEYICCNRNLERHCYLYDGMIPPAAIATAQQAFEQPTKRAGMRAVGLENIGRFTGAELPLADGTTGIIYNLSSLEGFTKREYAIMLHPCATQPLYAKRENVKVEVGGQFAWGKWQLIDKLPDMRGFSSAPAKTLSEKQAAWWVRAAQAYGLASDGKVNRRNFAALPILSDLRVKLRAT